MDFSLENIPLFECQRRHSQFRIVVQAQPRTQHDDGRCIIVQLFTHLNHESPAVARANAKGKTSALPFMRINIAITVNVQPESITSSTKRTGALRISCSTE